MLRVRYEIHFFMTFQGLELAIPLILTLTP